MSSSQEKEEKDPTPTTEALVAALRRLDLSVSRSQSRRLIFAGRVIVDGEIVRDVHHSVRKGQTVAIRRRCCIATED